MVHITLYLSVVGSVVGSVILSFGFYTVIWGKAREGATKTVSDSEQSLLLPAHNREDETLSWRCVWLYVNHFSIYSQLIIYGPIRRWSLFILYIWEFLFFFFFLLYYLEDKQQFYFSLSYSFLDSLIDFVPISIWLHSPIFVFVFFSANDFISL